mmetsp:Transcript_20851/g.30914  ORF Transcript_20851/g.30914 Transcript_20851/m.30914 type:complete len:523 (-) Transcript_20851:44-1612(-)|eukprot:CAMPEP_0171455768 /NCGR_PEP_ID=MMETSP0945-20130129/2529_1 /TAXON_ID=109269 /ORGANISM="Vaucheria litorea, Strain CCMP2940" /LENGTH=522 /DNA_ID=CAMNT_0011981071 /DNA_START=52 /DNA_END=1620 /DNA_ORIENTATION=+
MLMKQLFLIILLFRSVSEASESESTDILYLSDFQGRALGENDGWILSKDPLYEGQKVSIEAPSHSELKNEREIVLKKENKFYGLGTLFKEPISNSDLDEFVVQYEVRLPDRFPCGGAYLKFLRLPFYKEELENLGKDTPYSLMFGPDKCGNTDKVHFIMQKYNPATDTWEEKHLENSPKIRTDGYSHLYTLFLDNRDNSYEIFIDKKSVSKGALMDSMDPPIELEPMIYDSNDTKPTDWDDDEFIPDPNDRKPEDWDESELPTIPDPNAKVPDGWLENEPPKIPDTSAPIPEGWNEEEDGLFEPPLVDNPNCKGAVGCGTWDPPIIANPKYKGIWTAQLIENPNYKGEFVPKKIPNLSYYKVEHPAELAPMAGVAIEIWTTMGGIAMDNVLVAKSLTSAFEYASRTWEPKFEVQEKAMEDVKKEAMKAQEKDREKVDMLSGFKDVFGEWADKVPEFFNEPSRVFGTILAVFLGLAVAVKMFSGGKKVDEPKGVREGDEGVEETKDNATQPDQKKGESKDLTD